MIVDLVEIFEKRAGARRDLVNIMSTQSIQYLWR
jgi:hypothetical protein